MVHIIKVYFTGANQNVQIRRLAVNSEVVSRFDLLVRKIREMFHIFAEGPIEVTWKDSENDVIHMSSDEELAQALASAEDHILRIHAFSINNQQREDRANHNLKIDHDAKNLPTEMHPNVICDGCDKTIYGYRYKCLQCRNFDLCSECNAENKHENHDMVKLGKPVHIPREWVFCGARKFWRSMFGRCPASYFTTNSIICQNEQRERSDSGKDYWPGVLDNLLKGSVVSAEKLMKDNLGGFLNFMESASGNLDVKLERDPPKPTSSNEKQDNKEDQKNNNDSPKAGPAPTTTFPLLAEEVLKACVMPAISKTMQDFGLSVPSDVVKKEHNETTAKPSAPSPNEDIEKKSDKPAEEGNSDGRNQSLEKSEISVVGDSAEKKPEENTCKPCGLFGDNDIEKKSDKPAEEGNSDGKNQSLEKNEISVVGDSAEKKPEENISKPCLFWDNDSFKAFLKADGWTIVNKQENEKKDTSDNGAKPKHSSIYPSVPSFEVPQFAGEACAETKVKEIPSVQTDDAKILPKPAVAAASENDKFAKFQQNENVATNYNPEIMNALVKMQAMGFTNEGGWLERLLITKDGNINATLDALYPNTRRH